MLKLNFDVHWFDWSGGTTLRFQTVCYKVSFSFYDFFFLQPILNSYVLGRTYPPRKTEYLEDTKCQFINIEHLVDKHFKNRVGKTALIKN